MTALEKLRTDLLKMDIRPDWDNGGTLPTCNDRCPMMHDGKRCQETGFRPSHVCEPASNYMGRLLESFPADGDNSG